MALTDLLIDKKDFEAYVQVSEFGNDVKSLDPHILNAQNLDIAPVLGEVFFADLIENKDEQIYQELLNGKRYETETGNGKYVQFSGLKVAIVWFAMARKRANGNIIDSGWGMVEKTNEFSQPVSAARINQTVIAAESAGQKYLNDAIAFLKTNAATYPKFETECTASRKPRRRIKIKAISRI